MRPGVWYPPGGLENDSKGCTMKRGFSILVGVMLILLGGLALAFNFFAPILLPEFLRWGTWRLWPLIVVCGGLFFVVPPFLVRGKRGLGGLFIPGVPVLATGGILFYTSLFERWGDWEALWPIEVSALALGFLFAAIYMRVIWLLLPAIFLGANGAIFSSARSRACGSCGQCCGRWSRFRSGWRFC